jgi:predicted nucleotidyltransferase
MAARLAGYLRDLPSTVVRTHRDEIVRLAHQHRCGNVRVFGSVARGQDTYDSDVDFLVTPDDGATISDLALLPEELEKLMGMHVDVVSDGGLRANDTQILTEAVPL